MRALSLSLLFLLFSSTTFCAAFETAADQLRSYFTKDPYEVWIFNAIIALRELEEILKKNNSIHIDRWDERRECGTNLFKSLEYSSEVLRTLKKHIQSNPSSERKEFGLIEIDCILERCINQLERGLTVLETLCKERTRNRYSERDGTLMLLEESREKTVAFHQTLNDYQKLVRAAYSASGRRFAPEPEPRQELLGVLEKEKVAETDPTQFIISPAVPKPRKKQVGCTLL